MKKVVLALMFSGLLIAQNPPTTPPKLEKIDEAHKNLFGAKPNESTEAVRRSNALAAALPGATAPAGKIPHKNFIDRHIFTRIERDKVPHSGLASDEEFIRRAYLDATGELPTAKQVREFIVDKDPAKRDRLVDSLIGSAQYAEVWSWFWGDLFRLSGDTGYGRLAFQHWNKEWLKVDRPYNEVVTDLITVSSKTHGAIPALGLIGRNNIGLNNLPKSPDDFRLTNRLDVVDELGIDIARIFLGINTTCISCHDGAGHLEQINAYMADRTREEFHRHSAFFGKFRSLTAWSDRSKNTGNGDQFVDDLAPGYNTAADSPFMTESLAKYPRDGRSYEPAFLLTGEKPRPGANPRAELARMITSHIQFSRATVNLIWGRLMVVPFVEPFDGFDLARLDPRNPPAKPWTLQPTNPELLEALAVEFQKNNYSVQHLIRTIMKSNAYQLSTRFPAEWKDTYAPYYSRRFIRMMTGAEVVDAVIKVTNRPGNFTLAGVPAQRVKELSEPGDVGGRRAAPGASSEGGEISSLLTSFFQSNRNTQVPDGNKPSTLQALLMTSSRVINDRVLAGNGSRVQQLLESTTDNNQLIEELFLGALARKPTPQENEVMLRALERDRKQGAENIQWALLNSIEFVLNH